MVDCDYFEVIEWDEDTQEIYNAVCTMPSPCWPNCNRCQHRMEYRDVAAKLQEADAIGTYKPTTLLSSAAAELWQSDVDVLDGSANRAVRIDPNEDKEVKALYKIWKSL